MCAWCLERNFQSSCIVFYLRTKVSISIAYCYIEQLLNSRTSCFVCFSYENKT